MIDGSQPMMRRPKPALAIAALILAAGAAAQDESVVERLPPGDSDRVPLQTVVPAYPEKARRARVEGEVEVCFEVDRDGKTRKVAVRRSTNRVFEKPARDAVRASTYRPLADDEEVSGIKTCRTFTFNLESLETPN